MNLLLLTERNMREDNIAVVSGRQLAHAQQTLKIKSGDTLCVGLMGKQMGEATIISLDDDSMTLQTNLHKAPPAALPLTLIIALPRPKMLKRIIQTASTMGVKTIYFINAWKVEKSFWQSPWLSEEKILENCILGLEQARDTILPTIHQRKLFKPFVEDELAEIAGDSLKLVAHPHSETACPKDVKSQITLIIGPEGGFTPYEVAMLEQRGFQGVHLGSRILRVETAVPALLARLFTDC